MTKTPQPKFVRVASITLALAIILAQAAFIATPAYAAQITNRRLTLQAGSGGDGGSLPGGTVNHLLGFTLPSVGDTNVGSILFEYCDTAADTAVTTCTRPTGLDTSGGSLGAETGATGFTGFTASDTTVSGPGGGGEVNSVLLTKASAASVTAGTAVTYRLDNIINPSTTNETFFVRITTYPTTDGTGAGTDAGTVAASTASAIQLSGTMPESLVFCTGKSVPLAVGVPDCANATSGAVAFDQLFSPSATAVATSQMAASTNAGFGYAITVNGNTLESGANSISAMGTTGNSSQGVSQFGLNLVQNTNGGPGVGSSTNWATATPATANVSAASNGTNYKARPATDYGTADSFKYVSGNVVARSDSDGAGGQLGSPAASDAQIYTVSYIVNVPGSQAAGSYTTTLTYICTPTF